MKPRIMMISMKSNLRTMRYIGLLLMFIFCLTAQNMMAQRGKLFNSDNQLSSNLATQVFQDSNGFIWIATRNGLNIYDGYNFMVIRKTYNNSNGLNSNYINCITQDEKGRIVLGTNKSLLILNGKRFCNVPMLDSRNKPINTYVNQVSRLHNGDIAVVTSGYGIMTKKTDANACYTMKGEVENLKYIHKILEDKQERLWIILENGKLLRKEKNGKLVSRIMGTEQLNTQDIRQDDKGNIYLATKNDGVYLLKAGSTIFTKIAGIGNLPIDNIYISRDQRLFIGCDGMGIFVYNPVTGFLQNNPLFCHGSKSCQEQDFQHYRRFYGKHLGEYAPEGRIHAVAGSMRFQLYGLPFGQPQRDRRKQHHKSVCQPGRSSLGGHRQGWSLPL